MAYGTALLVNPGRKRKKRNPKKKHRRIVRGRRHTKKKGRRRSAPKVVMMINPRRKRRNPRRKRRNPRRKHRRNALMVMNPRRKRRNPHRKSRRNPAKRRHGFRRNPGSMGGMLKSAISMLKQNGPGAVGAAALDLWGTGPILARLKVPAKWAPLGKLFVGIGAALLVDKFLPRWRRHAESLMTGMTAFAAKDALAAWTGHPEAQIKDLAMQYSDLVAMQSGTMDRIPAGPVHIAELSPQDIGLYETLEDLEAMDPADEVAYANG